MSPQRVLLRAKSRSRSTTSPEIADRSRVVHDVVPLPLASIKANARNARTPPKKQIGQIAESIRAFGFRDTLATCLRPVLTSVPCNASARNTVRETFQDHRR
jgi:hypothetical protein